MLDLLAAEARARAAALDGDRSLLERAATSLPPPRDLAAALREPGLSVIAEVKRRSPSAGIISPRLEPGRLAASYVTGGAAAVSVLTEPRHFGALPDDLAAVTRQVPVPVLRKDFVVAPVQVWETRAMGADAVLLIVGVVGGDGLQDLVTESAAAGLAALVEAHSAEEVRIAVDAGARIVGVNNRDLATFAVDSTTAERLRPLVPAGIVTVAESGVSDAATAARLREAGYDAVLVGEAAVRATDPAAFVAALRAA